MAWPSGLRGWTSGADGFEPTPINYKSTILMHRDENLFADATPAISAASAALRAGQFDVVYTDGHRRTRK
eukprot:5211342-Amphidinium_carterae.5